MEWVWGRAQGFAFLTGVPGDAAAAGPGAALEELAVAIQSWRSAVGFLFQARGSSASGLFLVSKTWLREVQVRSGMPGELISRGTESWRVRDPASLPRGGTDLTCGLQCLLASLEGWSPSYPSALASFLSWSPVPSPTSVVGVQLLNTQPAFLPRHRFYFWEKPPSEPAEHTT